MNNTKQFSAMTISNIEVIILDGDNAHYEQLNRLWIEGETLEDFAERVQYRVNWLNANASFHTTKVFQCNISWLHKDIEFRFPALNRQDFINKLKEGLAQSRESCDYKIGEITEYGA